VALFRELHKATPAPDVEAALAELRKLEGGFVAQATFNDWVGFPGPLMGSPGLYANGIQMMGCCPPEGMRGLWEAWTGAVEERPDGVRVNMAFTVEHPAAAVRAFVPGDGGLQVTVRRAGRFLLRPPAWTQRDTVRLSVDNNPVPVVWDGPGYAYVVCDDQPREVVLELRWAVPEFTQTHPATSVPGREQEVTVRWRGNEVADVTPRGRYLPMFGDTGI